MAHTPSTLDELAHAIADKIDFWGVDADTIKGQLNILTELGIRLVPVIPTDAMKRAPDLASAIAASPFAPPAS